MRAAVLSIIVLTFVGILAVWGVYAFIVVKSLDAIDKNCKQGLAKCAGQMFKQVKDGMDGK